MTIFRQFEPDAQIQFYGSPINFASLACIKAIPRQGEYELAEATAWLVRQDGTTFLFSNWHVFSGRCRVCGQTLNLNSRVPDNIVVRFHTPILNEQDGGEIRFNNAVYPLEGSVGANWVQHPQGQTVDVGVLKLADVPNDAFIGALEFGASIAPEDLRVTNSVFIVGFPSDVSLFRELPVWRRGTVSSEAYVGTNGVASFLVDAETRRGMSGSPVFVRQSGVGLPSLKLVGIYSGRLVSNDAQSYTIGRVWPISFLAEAWNSQTRGSYQIIGAADREEHCDCAARREKLRRARANPQ